MMSYDAAPIMCTYEKRVARKQHTCCECRQNILPGTCYFYYKSFFDGHWGESKSCVRCSALAEDYLRIARGHKDWEETYTIGSLFEEIGEFIRYQERGPDVDHLRERLKEVE